MASIGIKNNNNNVELNGNSAAPTETTTESHQIGRYNLLGLARPGSVRLKEDDDDDYNDDDDAEQLVGRARETFFFQGEPTLPAESAATTMSTLFARPIDKLQQVNSENSPQTLREKTTTSTFWSRAQTAKKYGE